MRESEAKGFSASKTIGSRKIPRLKHLESGKVVGPVEAHDRPGFWTRTSATFHLDVWNIVVLQLVFWYKGKLSWQYGYTATSGVCGVLKIGHMNL